MQVNVTTRHISDQLKSENLRQYVLKKVKRIERYIKSDREPSEVRFILTVEKFRNTAELLINSGNLKATSSVQTDDMHSAIDRVIESIIKQLKKKTDKKYRIKRRDSLKTQQQIRSSEVSKDEEIATIIFEKLPKKPMSIDEAFLQLKVSDLGFIAFTNSETGLMNVLYRRKGGEIALIEP
jgi:putative sigma-54 modulation protein